MRKLLLFAVMAMAIVCLVMPACSTLDDVVVPPTIEEEETIDLNAPYISSLYNSDCYDVDFPDPDSIWGNSRGWEEDPFYIPCYLEMTILDRTAKCVIRQYEDGCDMNTLKTMTYRSDSIITLVIEEKEWPSGTLLRTCLCYYDIFFTLEDLPEEDFYLEIFMSNEGETYKNKTPAFKGQIEYRDSAYYYKERWEYIQNW